MIANMQDHLYKQNMIEELDPILNALSDPTRRAIIARLAEGEADVSDLAAPLPISQPAVSQHLKVLENAGLIATRIDGTRRPRRLVPDRLRDLHRWLRQIEQNWERSFARLDDLLEGLQKDGTDV